MKCTTSDTHTMHAPAWLVVLICFCTESASAMNCFPRRRPIIFSIKNFVNTKERVWTYKISKPVRIRCQYNLMRFITPEHIVYNRTFVYNGGRFGTEISVHRNFDLYG
uniref:Lipocalin n=1 Tax=Rhipicephalus zambeziensis TaxID=60191 RepID=A0A224YLJ4_9ACAR